MQNCFKIDYAHFWVFKNIERYSVRLGQLHTENNVEHSWFVATILSKLMVKYKYNNFNLLKYALIHDIGELITGDINSKCKTPEMRKILKNIEAPVLDAYMSYLDIEELTYTEHLLLKVADSLTVYFYGKINNIAEIKNDGFRMFKLYLRKFKYNVEYDEYLANFKRGGHNETFKIQD